MINQRGLKAPKSGTSGVSSAEPRTVGATDEQKAAGAWVKSLNVLTINPRLVALYLSFAPVAIQNRLMDIFRFWIDIHHRSLEAGRFGTDDEMLPLLEECARINDYARYGEE